MLLFFKEQKYGCIVNVGSIYGSVAGEMRIYNEEILSFIVKRITRTYSDIYYFVDRIDKLSLSKKKQITIPLIKELL